MSDFFLVSLLIIIILIFVLIVLFFGLFSSKDEVVIKKKSPEVEKILLHSKKDRAPAIASLRKNIALEIFGKSLVNSFVVDIIRNPNRARDPNQTVFPFAVSMSKYGVKIGFIELTQKRLMSAVNRINRVSKFFSHFKDTKKAFESLSGGVKPTGAISIYPASIVIVVECENNEDLAALMYHELYSQKRIEGWKEALDEAEKTRGCYLKYSANSEANDILVVVKKSKEGNDKITLEHEIQHAINNIFSESGDHYLEAEERENLIFEFLISSVFSREKDFEKASSDLLKFLKRILLNHAKNEILCFLTGVRFIKDIGDVMSAKKEDGGGYDFLGNLRNKIKFNPFLFPGTRKEKIFDELLNRVLVDDYYREINKAIEACILLEKASFGRRDIVSVFIDEPIEKWKKIAGNLISFGGLDLFKFMW